MIDWSMVHRAACKHQGELPYDLVCILEYIDQKSVSCIPPYADESEWEKYNLNHPQVIALVVMLWELKILTLEGLRKL